MSRRRPQRTNFLPFCFVSFGRRRSFWLGRSASALASPVGRSVGRSVGRFAFRARVRTRSAAPTTDSCDFFIHGLVHRPIRRRIRVLKKERASGRRYPNEARLFRFAFAVDVRASRRAGSLSTDDDDDDDDDAWGLRAWNVRDARRRERTTRKGWRREESQSPPLDETVRQDDDGTKT